MSSLNTNSAIISTEVVKQHLQSLENYNRLTAAGVILQELPIPDMTGYYVYDTDGSIKKIENTCVIL